MSNLDIRCPSCGAILPPHRCGEIVTVSRTACPVCNGEGKVFRMTDSYRAVVAEANGNSFGWTGPTHEWRTCHACGGSGLIR
jgi:uncharacterized C2H2 Zn-finger protein